MDHREACAIQQLGSGTWITGRPVLHNDFCDRQHVLQCTQHAAAFNLTLVCVVHMTGTLWSVCWTCRPTRSWSTRHTRTASGGAVMHWPAAPLTTHHASPSCRVDPANILDPSKRYTYTSVYPIIVLYNLCWTWKNILHGTVTYFVVLYSILYIHQNPCLYPG